MQVINIDAIIEIVGGVVDSLALIFASRSKNVNSERVIIGSSWILYEPCILFSFPIS